MTCEHDPGTLLLLLYGELPPDRQRATRLLVEGCASCQADLAELERGARLLDELGLPQVPVAVADRLALAVQGKVGRQGLLARLARQRTPRWLWPLAMAATLAVAAAGSLLLHPHDPRTSLAATSPPLAGLAWNDGTDERIASMDLRIASLRPGAGPDPLQPSAATVLDVDRRIENLRTQLAALTAGSERGWSEL